MSESYNPDMEKYAQSQPEPHPEEGDRHVEVDRLAAEQARLQAEAKRFFDKQFNPEVFEGITEEDIIPDYEAMVRRIDRETEALEEIKDTVSTDNLVRGLVAGQYAIPVEFGQDLSSEHKTGPRKETLGQFNPGSKTISIAEQPDRQELWAAMIQNGIPHVVETLDHEIAHHWFDQGERQADTSKAATAQDIKDYVEQRVWSAVFRKVGKAEQKIRKLETLDPRFGQFADKITAILLGQSQKRRDRKREAKSRENRKQGILTEVVAHKAEYSIGAQRNTTSDLVNSLSKVYGYDSPQDIDLIITASRAVDRLRVMGMNDQEIAQTLAQTKYDRKTASFPGLGKLTKRYLAKSGKDEDDLDTEMDVLRLKYKVENLKAQNIAQEEFVKLHDRLNAKE